MDLREYAAKPNKSIREHNDDLLRKLDVLKKLGYIKSDKVYELTKVACEYHDYGKVNLPFQERMRSKTKFNKNIEIAHNVLSLYFIDPNKFQKEEDYYKVGFAVWNHHSYCNNRTILDDEKAKMLIRRLTEGFPVFTITSRIAKNIWAMAENQDTVLIKGFLHRCDYSASAEVTIEYENDFLVEGLSHQLNKWREENSDANWNKLQEFCRKNTENNVIAVAQTGMGKTEAGLHWIGNGKGFFVLPLKTAINSIYKRVKDDILEKKEVERKLALLHSDSLSYYIKDNQYFEMDILDYYSHSKKFSMPLSISTADQLFDFVFKAPEYELKVATLSYSKIVVDEIQMYSPDILAFLISGMKKINNMGGRLAILTATFAPFIKELLEEGDNPLEFEEGTFIDDTKRHNLKLFNSKMNSQNIYEKYIKNKEQRVSNKILVVCNTVRKAQQMYEELKAKGVSNIHILHRKYTKLERSAKELEIYEFGNTENKGDGIWVTTQIVEASLDIDFDYLFTELSEISALFQRLGRVNRKGKKSIYIANCFIYLEIDQHLLINGDKGFIDRKIYEVSKQALIDENVEGILTEKKKLYIINKYLTKKKLVGSDYLIKYEYFTKLIERLSLYQIDKRDVRFRNIVSYDVIPQKIYYQHKNEIEENERLLHDSKIDKLKKVELKESIKQYTVPVGAYDIRGNNIKVKTIRLSNYESIDVVKCQYDELGFRRLEE